MQLRFSLFAHHMKTWQPSLGIWRPQPAQQGTAQIIDRAQSGLSCPLGQAWQLWNVSTFLFTETDALCTTRVIHITMLSRPPHMLAAEKGRYINGPATVQGTALTLSLWNTSSKYCLSSLVSSMKKAEAFSCTIIRAQIEDKLHVTLTIATSFNHAQI